jgi:acyl carrier protein
MDTSKAIMTAVRGFLLEIYPLADELDRLRPSASLMREHVLDSTGFLELVLFLQNRYSIKIGDEEMIPENLDSLGAIVQFVQCKMRACDDAEAVETASVRHATGGVR